MIGVLYLPIIYMVGRIEHIALIYDDANASRTRWRWNNV